ncbi:unnamed protein product [Symbiodinium sp. CCMP2592]|nr:unnamed protein product [Symbiodinium sp. CCMP2592]
MERRAQGLVAMLAVLLTFGTVAATAFVQSRPGASSEPSVHSKSLGDAPQPLPEETPFHWLSSASSHALTAGAVLGLVLALAQAPAVRAEDRYADVESQVVLAASPAREKAKKELLADAKKVDEFTKTKVRTTKDALLKYTEGSATDALGTEFNDVRPTRSKVRKSLQKESGGFKLAGLPDLPSFGLPSLPSAPGVAAPELSGDAGVGIASGAAVALALPALGVAGVVNSRISEKQREDAERRAREANSLPVGPILTVAGVGAAALVAGSVISSIGDSFGSEQVVEEVVTTAAPSKAADDKAAADKAAAEKKAAADKAAADKAAADKAAADKAAAEKAAADKAAADKASADKAAADKATADKAAADKAAADKAAADKAAAEKKAAADKAAADKAAADKAAADKAAAEAKAKADQAAAEKAAAQKAATKAPEPAAAPETEVAESKKVSRKGYFNYMRDKK